MKRCLLYILISSTFRAYSQDLPPFQLLRQEEDYSWLKYDSSGDWYRRTKFIPLSKTGENYLSLGGEARFQYFYVKNENWGDMPQDEDAYLLNRGLFHADLHTGKHFRLFTQLQGSTAVSRIDPGTIDKNPLDLHQAFAEWQNSVGKANLLVRLGRQELLYGSQRLVSVRDGPNSRQSFDGIKGQVNIGSHTTDIFYSRFVISKRGTFDDVSGENIQFWGSYHAISKPMLRYRIEYYYLGVKRRHAVFNDGAGKEVRHSIGMRIAGARANWHYDMESVYQIGRFAGKRIAAWTVSLNVSHKFSSWKLRPELGIKSELISGDKQKGDDRLQSFNPLYPRGAYFGLAALIGPVNLVDLHPSISITVCKYLSLDIDYDIFWRHRSRDGIYAVHTAPVYGDGNTSEKHIGRQLATSWIYRPNQFLYFRYEFTWFEAGDYLKTVSRGKDIIFTGITAQLKF